MLKTYKIKILFSQYIESSDLIRWDVFFLEDGSEQSYVWPSVDLLKSLNIVGNVEPSVLHKFCDDMNNKVIKIVIEKDVEIPSQSVSSRDMQKISEGIADHFTVFRNVVEGG